MNPKKSSMNLKLISLILIFSILIQIVLPLKSIGATLGEVNMKTTATSLKAGDTVELEIYLTGNSFSYFEAYMEYEPTVFETVNQATDITVNPELTGWNVGYTPGDTEFFSVSRSVGDVSCNGLLATITLKVLKDTDSSVFKLIDIYISNDSYESETIDTLEYTLPAESTQYNIKYYANTSDTVTGLPSTGTKNAGSNYTIQAGPTRTGYEFKGWNTVSNGTGTSYVAGSTYSVDADLDLYAQWELKTSSLVVNPNGGVWSGSSASQTFTQGYGTIKTIDAPTTTPNGNVIRFNANGGETTPLQKLQTTTFSGWTGATLDGTTYTFGLNNETLTANYIGDSITLPSATKTGSTFKGWYDAATGGNLIGDAEATYTPTYTTPNAVITLFAQYQEDTYTLTINPNGGTYSGSTTVTGTYNSTKTISNPTAPNGYTVTLNNEGTTSQLIQTKTFSEWTVISGDGTISGTTYTFGTQDGEIQANYTANTVELPEPTKTGYTFDGWYTQETGGTKVTSPYMPTSDITLYAHWTPVQSTLTVNPNGGVWEGSANTQTFTQNYQTTKEINNPTAPNANIITFNSNGGTEVAPITQTTTFSGWTGATLSGTTYTFGVNNETLTANYTANSITLPNVTKTGETFIGWSTDAEGNNIIGGVGDTYTPTYTTPNASITLYAQFEEETYTLTVNPNGGTYNGTTENSSIEGTSNSNKTIENPVAPNGYTVTLNNEGTTSQLIQTKTFSEWTVISGDGTISGTTYTFGTQDGEIQANYTANTVELPEPTKTGYTFDGWYTQETGGTKVTSPYMPTSDITLYAHWTIVQSTLTVNPNGGVWEGNTNSQTFTQDYQTTKEINNPTAPNGYTVTLNNEGTTSQLISTKTFKQWNVISGDGTISGTTYTFGAQDGEIKAEYESGNVILPEPTKTGYTFDGWYTQETGGTKVTSPYTPTSDITLYAHWTIVQSTLTVNPNGGVWEGSANTQTFTQDYQTTKEINNPTAPNANIITFNSNGGTEVAPITQTTTFSGWTGATLSGTTYTFGLNDETLTANYTANSITLPSVTKTGGTFIGWSTDVEGNNIIGGVGDTYTPAYTTPNASITLYAQFEEDIYTLTINPNGGTYNGTTEKSTIEGTYNSNKTIENPVAPNGYTVTLNNEGTTSQLIQTKTFKQWNVISGEGTISGTTYTFGTQDGEIKAEYEPDNVILPEPTKRGYTFDGWYTQETEGTKVTSPYMPTSDITLYAHWTLNTYTLTINPNGGTYNGTTENSTIEGIYNSNETIENPVAPNGYTITLNNEGTTSQLISTKTFKQWNVISGDGTISGTTYTFGTQDGEIKAEYESDSVILPEPTKTGYTFDGWYTEGTEGTEGTKVTLPYIPTSDVTLTAKYTINKYTVTFKNDDGTILTTIPANHGTSIVYTGDTPVKSDVSAGYEATFAGWDNESGLQNITEDVTLTATYTISPIVYTITYNNLKDNDNSANPTTYTIEDSNITLVDLPDQGKYIFKGWYTTNDETGIKVTSIDTSKLGNIILHAQWENDTLYFKSEKYKVGENDIDNYEDGDVYLNKINPDTTLSEFIDNCDTNGKITVLNEEGQALSSGDLVATTMTIKVTKNDEEITMTIVVMGDIDGDGKSTAQDLSEENKSYLGISEELTGARFKAADIDDSEKITATDFSELNRASLGISKLIYIKPNK